MKGVVDFLLGASPHAALLRDSFLFKLVPMLNPDGVIVGNSRCSLAGSDLNRSYKSVLRECFPSVAAVRAMVQRLREERTVLLYCDFHGHSRRHNAFLYGCESPTLAHKDPHARVFPLMLSRKCPDLFSFQGCRFGVHRSKEATGRVALWRLGVLNSFTLEASFCGSDMGQRKGTHFSTRDLQMLGVHFCDTLLDYCDPDKYSTCVRELQELMGEEKVGPPHPQSGDTETQALPPTHHQDSANGSSSSESEEAPAPFRTLKEEGNRDTLERRPYELKPLKVPPTIHKRSELRRRHSNLPEARKSDEKSERLEHLVAEYLHGRGQQGRGRALLAPLGQRSEPPHLPKARLSTLSRLPGRPALTTGDTAIGQLPAS
ncbi:hypothetical protein AAFF_G00173390 [Aldrovandia affinis]|uniref:Peptidase M14 domain-containing protein n=1 Tax=Aldrovandia affinis TaxID=143900 RepID=A0AAD7SZP9_9TELE|nr:hypothetical protein AAFF_G00173390 [Aldrovandia affinis]